VEIKIVKTPFQGVNTEPKDINHPNDTWCVRDGMYRNGYGGLNLWFKEIDRVKPDIIYLYDISSSNTKIVNGHNEEDWIDDIITIVRYQFKKLKTD
jgi:hypothetical protein